MKNGLLYSAVLCFLFVNPQLEAQLSVTAQIDGRSQLVITKNKVFWRHIEYARPGKYGPDQPTILNGYEWYPVWADPFPFNPGDSKPLGVSVGFTGDDIAPVVNVGRGTVTIVEQPTTWNDYTLIVEFYDAPEAADMYEVTLSGVDLLVLPTLDIRVASVAITFTGDPGVLYQVQVRPTPTSSEWIDLGDPIEGTDIDTVLVDIEPGKTYQLFRVLPLR